MRAGTRKKGSEPLKVYNCRSYLEHCSLTQSHTPAIEAATGFTRSELRIVDLSKFSSVVEFANKCDNDRERLDVYVYNAGVYFADYEATEDGWETTYV